MFLNHPSYFICSILQGRLTCVPKFQGLRTDTLNEQTCTLSNDTLAVKDRKDEKGIVGNYAYSGLNFWLIKSSGCTGKYWPRVVAVHTKCSKVCTKLTKGQHSPVQLKQVRLVSSLLNGPSTKVVYLEFLWPKIHSLWLFSWKKSVQQNMDKYKPIRLLGFTSGLPCHRIIYYNATRHSEGSCKWLKC